MAMLSHEEFSDSIRWLPHGKSFEILNPDKFHSKVFPLFFKNCKQKSFERKLNRWGFRRITKGPDANSFYNEKFSRDGTDIPKMHCHYSQKELPVRRQTDKNCCHFDECSSLSSFEHPNHSGSPPRSFFHPISIISERAKLHNTSAAAATASDDAVSLDFIMGVIEKYQREVGCGNSSPLHSQPKSDGLLTSAVTTESEPFGDISQSEKHQLEKAKNLIANSTHDTFPESRNKLRAESGKYALDSWERTAFEGEREPNKPCPQVSSRSGSGLVGCYSEAPKKKKPRPLFTGRELEKQENITILN